MLIEWLRNLRGAAAVLPFAVRARPGAPVAAPIPYDELRNVDSAAHFHLADDAELVRPATCPDLQRWRVAEQHLPDY